ncbi:MAG TPA: hypothetical protein ENK57_02075 [Polyangiaceae bacterium]|nr:hypothetical protein [Polyangiaceae bacterium]
MKRAAIGILLCGGAVAFAAASVPAEAQEVSARDRESAGEAYDRGTAAYLSGDYSTAARWFETAHRLAPAAAALVQATRSHTRAGNPLRAATLALRLQALYPDDPAATAAAQQALSTAGDFLRVDVTCDDECTIEVDGAIMSHTSFFLDADGAHDVTAEFATGRQTLSAEGAAGETIALAFEAPEGEPVPAPVNLRTDPTPEADGGGDGIPLGVTITALVVTAGLGGVLIWSGVDTLDGVPAYEDNPTAEALADGRSREERTNWLIGSTAVAGAATLIMFIFTDFGGDDGEAATDAADGVDAEAFLDLDAEHAILGVTGHF